MSISTSIAALQADKAAIAAAITAKGGTVNEGDGYNDFATDIGTIATRKTTSSLGYVASDIVYHFDGDKNVAGYPHDSNMTTKWCDLKGNGGYRASGNIGANHYQTNGTSETMLRLQPLSFSSQVTFEAVFEWLELGTVTVEQDICSNFDSSGFGFFRLRTNEGHRAEIHIGGNYRAVHSSSTIVVNKKYALQCSYNGKKIVLFENGVKVGEMSITGIIDTSSTLFGIGGAGRGTYYSKIKCYSLRVYSRGLTEAELAQNWAADAERFGIT